MKIHRLLHKLSEYILGTAFTALILWLIYRYVPIANNKRWTAIVVLCLVIMLLVWFIRAAGRFHFSVVDASFKAADQISNEYAASNVKIHQWTLFKGRYDGLYCLLDLRRWPGSYGEPLARAEIEYLEADLRNKIQDSYGPHGMEEWFERPGEIPQDTYRQVRRLQYHSSRLAALIDAEKGHHRAINDKAEWQRQALIRGQINDVMDRLQH